MSERYKYLHIVPQNGGGSFLSRILVSFDTKDYKTSPGDHLWVTNDKGFFDFANGKHKVIYSQNDMVTNINKYGFSCDWIFIHGLSVSSLRLLFIKPHLCRKIIWRTWGHDISVPSFSTGGILKNLVRVVLLLLLKLKARHFYAIGVANVIDEMKVKSVFGEKTRIINIPYSRSLLEEKKLVNRVGEIYNNTPKDNVFRVMIGHSADCQDNHIEIIKQVSRFRNANILFYIMLPYGRSDYSKKVASFAVETLGDKAILVTEKKNYEGYCEFIASMDVAVLDMQKSSALGNIALLMRFEKKIYLNPKGDIYKAITRLNIPCYSSSIIGSESLDDFVNRPNYDGFKACSAVSPWMVDPNFGVNQWNALFDSLES